MKSRSARGLVSAIAALSLLGACAEALQLPPASPLSASAEQLAEIPRLETGDYAVVTADAQWTRGKRRLRMRVVRPDTTQAAPLVIFSHGFASGPAHYDALLEHWASHGYLSIAMRHRDGGGMPRAIFNSLRFGNAGLIRARLEDVQQILDGLDDLDSAIPGLAARIDQSRITIAGHSFGAFTAQQFGGARVIDPDSGEPIGGHDPRVRAVVAISPPGEMFGLINAGSWKSMQLPMLVTTGTWDLDGRFVTDWRQHRLSFDTAPPGDNRLLVIEGADHYLGNLICRTKRDAPPQRDALRIVNATVVNFLDQFARLQAKPARPPAALEALTNGFATLQQR